MFGYDLKSLGGETQKMENLYKEFKSKIAMQSYVQERKESKIRASLILGIIRNMIIA